MAMPKTNAMTTDEFAVEFMRTIINHYADKIAASSHLSRDEAITGIHEGLRRKAIVLTSDRARSRFWLQPAAAVT
jgi:hypothetical protein